MNKEITETLTQETNWEMLSSKSCISEGISGIPKAEFALESSIMWSNFCFNICGAKRYYINMVMDDMMLLSKSNNPIALVIAHSILVHI